jgi:hypothetical protein
MPIDTTDVRQPRERSGLRSGLNVISIGCFLDGSDWHATDVLLNLFGFSWSPDRALFAGLMPAKLKRPAPVSDAASSSASSSSSSASSSSSSASSSSSSGAPRSWLSKRAKVEVPSLACFPAENLCLCLGLAGTCQSSGAHKDGGNRHKWREQQHSSSVHS